MARDVINDNPSGWSRSLPGHTVELQPDYAQAWCDRTIVGVASGATGTYSLTFGNVDWIYFADMISITPHAFKEFAAIIFINGHSYVSASSQGWINIPLRQNPSIQFINGDILRIDVINLAPDAYNFNIKINGTKIQRPANFGHAPGAYFTAAPVITDIITPVVFADGTDSAPTSWDWDFADGSPHSILQNPTHYFTTPGHFAPKLKATNLYGWDSYSEYEMIAIWRSCYLLAYTEVDPGGKLSCDYWTAIVAAAPSNTNSYLYMDYGVSHFSSYDVSFQLQCSLMGAECIYGAFSFGNGLHSINGAVNSCVSVMLQKTGGVQKIVLQYNLGAVVVNDSYNSLVADARGYYCRLVHAFGSNDVTLAIYSDAAFTVLLDVLTVSHANLAALQLRYLYATRSYNSGSANTISCLSNNIVFNSWS